MKDQLVGMFLVVESTGHEHYRTGHIAEAICADGMSAQATVFP